LTEDGIYKLKFTRETEILNARKTGVQDDKHGKSESADYGQKNPP